MAMNSLRNQLAVGLALSLGMSSIPACAQVHHKKKHISPAVAGIAAYEVAKHTGKPGHKNFMQRHPVMTGLGAAYLAHKYNKKHKH